MSNAMPYCKWYPRDWLGDPLLRMMAPADKGVWIDLLSVMMMADPYGHLAVNGRAMTDEEAARLIGTDIGTYKGCVEHLVSAGVPSFTESGVMFSRRLVRDYARYMKASESGHKGGGNPRLQKNKPETRSQKPEATQPIKVPFIDTYIGMVSFPLLKTPEFATAFDSWLEFRKAKKAPATERVIHTVLSRLSERPTQAVAAIDTCMVAGWTDVRWDWIDNRNAKQTPIANPANRTSAYVPNFPSVT